MDRIGFGKSDEYLSFEMSDATEREIKIVQALAAPKLLEALKRLTDGKTFQEDVKFALQAIAQAEGK